MKYPMVKSEYDRFWQRYCGFLDLSLDHFMAIQHALLAQQLKEVAEFPVMRKIMGDSLPSTVEGFRRSAPLTTYEDYLPELELDDASKLPAKPYVWAHTSGPHGFKKVPYTLSFYNRMLDNLMAVFILACSRKKGQSSLTEDDRVLYNVAPSPYLSGILARGASERFNLRPVIQPDAHDDMDFKDKVAKGFEVSLKTGVDILIAMTSVLVKMGNDFSRRSRNGRMSKHTLHPAVLYSYARALVQSKMEKRPILPKDLWSVKAIISWGMDTDIYREQVHQYWGRYPYEFHACTEAGIMAMQSWTKKHLTFVPDSNFFEFIPEVERLKSKADSSYCPRTLLLSEVKPGELYELVITSFYQMPFVRYRLGHLVRITALQDDEAGIRLPQMVFEGRADDLIDIAGFTRIGEKEVSRALVHAGLGFSEWSIRKETRQGKPVLHLYMELDSGYNAEEVAAVMHQSLRSADAFYADLDRMMGIRPLEVTLLRPGTFRDYYDRKRIAGEELARRKPPRMNAPDDIIEELVRLGSRMGQENLTAI